MDHTAGPIPALEPRTLEEMISSLREAATRGSTVRPLGAGTKINWSGEHRTDSTLSTSGLPAVVDHVAGDLTATVSAGMTLESVNRRLARERQWLPLDPYASGRATIGGIVAANDSGPRRHKHGTPRDLILGIEMVLADGRVAKAGGRVVKNVAGYDLARLLCGSYGSLAMITRATFKLSPRPPDSATLVVEADDGRRIAAMALALAAAPLAPSALELDAPPFRLLVRFETTPRATAQQAETARQMVARERCRATILTGEAETAVWAEAQSRLEASEGTLVKIAALPTALDAVLAELETADATDVTYYVCGRAALGVLFVRLHGSSDEQAAVAGRLRAAAQARGGTAMLLEGDDVVRSGCGAWAYEGDAMSLMRAVKARFDPAGVLPPIPGDAGQRAASRLR